MDAAELQDRQPRYPVRFPLRLRPDPRPLRARARDTSSQLNRQPRSGFVQPLGCEHLKKARWLAEPRFEAYSPTVAVYFATLSTVPRLKLAQYTRVASTAIVSGLSCTAASVVMTPLASATFITVPFPQSVQ